MTDVKSLFKKHFQVIITQCIHVVDKFTVNYSCPKGLINGNVVVTYSLCTMPSNVNLFQSKYSEISQPAPKGIKGLSLGNW